MAIENLQTIIDNQKKIIAERDTEIVNLKNQMQYFTTQNVALDQGLIAQLKATHEVRVQVVSANEAIKGLSEKLAESEKAFQEAIEKKNQNVSSINNLQGVIK